MFTNNKLVIVCFIFDFFIYILRRERQTETDRDSQRQTETDRDRQRQTETDRDRKRQTETDRDRQRQTETDRKTDKQTDKRLDRFTIDNPNVYVNYW